MKVTYKTFNTIGQAMDFCNTNDKIIRVINLMPSSYVHNINYNIMLPSDYVLIYEEEC